MTTITIDRAVLEQALEALDCVCNDERTCDVLHHGRAEYHAIGEACPAVKRLWVAAHKLRAALNAPQPQPEPVVLQLNGLPPFKDPPADVIKAAFHVSNWADSNGWRKWRIGHCCSEDYAPPRREWVSLTDAEIENLQIVCIDPVDANGWGFLNRERFARAIEAALKERNHE